VPQPTPCCHILAYSLTSKYRHPYKNCSSNQWSHPRRFICWTFTTIIIISHSHPTRHLVNTSPSTLRPRSLLSPTSTSTFAPVTQTSIAPLRSTSTGNMQTSLRSFDDLATARTFLPSFSLGQLLNTDSVFVLLANSCVLAFCAECACASLTFWAGYRGGVVESGWEEAGAGWGGTVFWVPG
jgi:hypothetical protein